MTRRDLFQRPVSGSLDEALTRRTAVAEIHEEEAAEDAQAHRYLRQAGKTKSKRKVRLRTTPSV